MAELYSSGGLPPAQQAEQYYKQGLELKKAGDLDTALTEFRRAALLDPSHFQAQMEIGRLCKLRAKTEPIFNRHTFEAFRQAARLDLTNTEAHDEYIMAAKKLDRLDELLREYDNWLKFNPANDLIARCRKNILTISMAMIPEKVEMKAGSDKSRRVIVLMIAAVIFIGLALFAGVAFFRYRAQRTNQSALRGSPQSLGAPSGNPTPSSGFQPPRS